MSVFSSLFSHERLNDVTDVTIALRDAAYQYPDGSSGLTATTVTFEPTHTHTALIGLNGAGKSTLLDLITGTVVPTQGEVQVEAGQQSWNTNTAKDRRDVKRMLPLVRAEHIPPAIEQAQSIETALAHELKRLHVDDTAARAIIERVFSRFDLTQLSRMPVTTLDAEQIHMLTLAVACARNPAVLVADEPTKGLDEISTAHVAQALFHCGKPVIFATHDIDLVRNADNLIDRVLVLDDQRIVFDGPANDACEHYSEVIRAKYASVMRRHQ
ncbi:ATP-binding cassette domain-containing protein [Bifidobacterium gallicum]|nr:ATP-binding cassette domain-containing protein [Bifidobacterium gallicum]